MQGDVWVLEVGAGGGRGVGGRWVQGDEEVLELGAGGGRCWR